MHFDRRDIGPKVRQQQKSQADFLFGCCSIRQNSKEMEPIGGFLS